MRRRAANGGASIRKLSLLADGQIFRVERALKASPQSWLRFAGLGIFDDCSLPVEDSDVSHISAASESRSNAKTQGKFVPCWRRLVR